MLCVCSTIPSFMFKHSFHALFSFNLSTLFFLYCRSVLQKKITGIKKVVGVIDLSEKCVVITKLKFTYKCIQC